MMHMYPIFDLSEVYGIQYPSYNLHHNNNNNNNSNKTALRKVNPSLPPLSPSSPTSSSQLTSHMVIQGSVSNRRRNYHELFEVLEISNSGSVSHSVNSNSNNNKNINNIKRDGNFILPWKLHVVGHNAKQLSIPVQLATQIRLHDRLSFPHYYRLLAQDMDIMIGYLKDEAKHYDWNRASSSIPTAILSHLPIALAQHHLQLYPCLRDQRIHQYMSQVTNAATMMRTLHLNQSTLQMAKQEAIFCFQEWQQHNQRQFQQLIRHPSNNNNNNNNNNNHRS
jgi:hypothetical protein